MKRRRVGSTRLEVSELGFGAASIGNLRAPVDDETAAATLRAAWDAGVRYFDTAPHYGLGLSERRLGAALAGLPRDEFVVSTKVGRLLVPNPSPTGSDLDNGFAVPDDLTRARDYSRDGVLRSLESSLDRLGLDRVDIVYVHDPDEHLDEAIAGAVPALAELRDTGVVGAIGAGMNFWEPLLRIVRESDVDVVMLAGRWTLLDRSGEPLLAECLERGVSVVAAAVFNSGLLARSWPPDDALFNYGPAPQEVLARARALARVCQELGTTLPEAAARFGLRHPAVPSVVVGTASAGHVTLAAQRATAELPDRTWQALDEVVAGWTLPRFDYGRSEKHEKRAKTETRLRRRSGLRAGKTLVGDRDCPLLSSLRFRRFGQVPSVAAQSQAGGYHLPLWASPVARKVGLRWLTGKAIGPRAAKAGLRTDKVKPRQPQARLAPAGLWRNGCCRSPTCLRPAHGRMTTVCAPSSPGHSEPGRTALKK